MVLKMELYMLFKPQTILQTSMAQMSNDQNQKIVLCKKYFLVLFWNFLQDNKFGQTTFSSKIISRNRIHCLARKTKIQIHRLSYGDMNNPDELLNPLTNSFFIKYTRFSYHIREYVQAKRLLNTTLHFLMAGMRGNF